MGSTGRTRFQTLAAGLLALGSGLEILYAGFVPIPPFSHVPVPLASGLFGIVGLAAAIGIFGGRAWGRALGVGVVAIDLALLGFLMPIGNAPGMIASVAFRGVPDGFILWVLLRRWPARP
jgi:hypothetical protein